jgi:hypothetical protein
LMEKEKKKNHQYIGASSRSRNVSMTRLLDIVRILIINILNTSLIRLLGRELPQIGLNLLGRLSNVNNS